MLRFIHLRPAVLTLTLATFAIACTDNPVDPNDGHPHPDGLLINMNGQTIVTVEEGVPDGSLIVAEGDETPRLEVVFIDHDGDPLPADDDTYMEVEVTDEAVAGFNQATPGDFGGRLEGISAGQTSIRFKLMHGQVGSGHLEWTSPAIDITVVPSGA